MPRKKKLTPMTKEEKKSISRLRSKIRRKSQYTKKKEEQELAQHAEDLKNAKVVTLYNKEPCAVPGCKYLAVGKDDVCKKHGGTSLIRENLLKDEEIPDAVLTGTKYDPTVHPMQFIELAREGMSEVEIAAQFQVSIYTMRGWAEKFEHFNSAYEIGQAMYEAWWQAQGKDNLNNRSYNTGLFKFLTMNNLGWSDKVESKNLHVQAGVLVAPAPQTPDSWEEQYAQDSDKSE